MTAATRSGGSVVLSVEDGIAVLTLDRPEALNAFDLPMARELRRLGDQLAARDDVRVVVVRGNGPSFCAGADVRLFRGGGDAAAAVREILSELHAFIRCLTRMRPVVLMSVHGAVAGGGMSLASHGDLCVAAEGTRFISAYHRLALSPDMGATFTLARAIGARRALQTFLHDDRVSARQALEWGLVNWVVPDDDLASETSRIARRVATNAPGALAATKRLVRGPTLRELEARMAEELEAVVSCILDPAFGAAVEGLAGGRGPSGAAPGGSRGGAP